MTREEVREYWDIIQRAVECNLDTNLYNEKLKKVMDNIKKNDLLDVAEAFKDGNEILYDGRPLSDEEVMSLLSIEDYEVLVDKEPVEDLSYLVGKFLTSKCGKVTSMVVSVCSCPEPIKLGGKRKRVSIDYLRKYFTVPEPLIEKSDELFSQNDKLDLETSVRGKVEKLKRGNLSYGWASTEEVLAALIEDASLYIVEGVLNELKTRLI